MNKVFYECELVVFFTNLFMFRGNECEKDTFENGAIDPQRHLWKTFFFQDRIKEDGKHPDAELKF